MAEPQAAVASSSEPASLRRATRWSVALNGGRVITSSVVLFVLAGLLGPEAFGTVAIATIYVLFLQLAFQQGLAPALISRADVSGDVLDVAFRLALLGSLIMLGASLALADLLGMVFGNGDLASVIRALSFLLPLFAIDLVPDALTRRSSDFRFLALRTNLSVVIGGIAGVVAAVCGWGIWALVLQQLLTAGTSTALLFIRTRWRPRWRGPWPWHRRDLTRQLLGYSLPASAAATLQFLADYMDNLIVGLFSGSRAVGLYRLAGRVVATLYDVTVRSGQMALLPDFVRRKTDDAASLHDRFLDVQRRATSVTLPLFGILAGSSLVLPSLLGTGWEPAAQALLLLSVAAMVSAMTAAVTPALQAVAETRLLAVVNGTSLGGIVLAVTTVGALVRDQALGQQLAAVAGARLAVALLVALPLSLWALRRAVGVGGSSFLRACGGGLLTAFASAVTGQAVTAALPADMNPLVGVAVIGGSASLVAFLFFVVLNRNDITTRIRRRRPPN